MYFNKKLIFVVLLFFITFISLNGIYATGDNQNLSSENNFNNISYNNTNNNQSYSNGNDNQNNEYMAAGEGNLSFTNEQITNATVEVKNYLEITKTLPTLITINGTKINQAQFLHLLTTVILKINNTNTTTTTLINANLPTTTGTETIVLGTLNKTEYLTIAQNILTYINTNQKAPSTITSNIGTINYQSLIYMYTRALNMYNTNKALPTYLAVKAWTASNLPITDTSKTSITTSDVINTAIAVKGYIEAYKTLPEYININGIIVNQATFLSLLTKTTLQLNTGSTTTLNLVNIAQPTTTGTETIVLGTLNKTEYLTIAQNILTYINTNQKAPSTITSNIGTINYQSLIYMYTRALNMYNTNKALPTYLIIKAWTASNLPITDTTKTSITTSDVINTAIAVKNYLETTTNLPEYININGIIVNQATFLSLLTKTTLQVSTNNNTPLGLKNTNQPGSCKEIIIDGTLNTTEYLEIAQDILTYINNNNQAPASCTSTLGTMNYQSLIYMYCRVLLQYDSNKYLPKSIMVTSWFTPILEDYFSNLEIMNVAVEVKTFFVVTDTLPTLITIRGVQVNQAQFLQLLTTVTLKLNNHDNSYTYLQRGIVPSISSNIVFGTLSLDNYIDLAQNINICFQSNNYNGPISMSSSIGEINFQTLLYTYCRILESYRTNNALPSSMILYKPIYVTSDNIYDSATDWNRMAALIDLLRNAGANAHAYGIGPDTQNGVLRASYVPQSALVVDIYGGACAGTIYAMIGSYYQGIKGSREVYSIWISPPAWDITNLPTKAINNGVNFLPRAHDDTFSKYLPNSGYNTAGVWTDGLTNPDQFLTSHGFNFLVTSGALTEMANNILDQAKN